MGGVGEHAVSNIVIDPNSEKMDKVLYRKFTCSGSKKVDVFLTLYSVSMSISREVFPTGMVTHRTFGRNGGQM